MLRNPLVKLASASVASDRVARKLSRVDGPDEIDLVSPVALPQASSAADRNRSRRRSRSSGARRDRRAG